MSQDLDVKPWVLGSFGTNGEGWAESSCESWRFPKDSRFRLDHLRLGHRLPSFVVVVLHVSKKRAKTVPA